MEARIDLTEASLKALIEKLATDDEFRAELAADPAETLADYGIHLPDEEVPQNIALPRQIAMYLCRTITEQSLPTIGNAFGRNHATVLHACRLVTDKMNDDQNFRQTISLLTNRIAAPLAASSSISW